MGLWDKLKGEFIDIIQWTDDSNNTLVYRFPRYNAEIKYGAKLVVREGQAAIFLNEGKLADVFQPGTHSLTTQNLPILSTLMGWKYGFESPFKADVYYVNMRRYTDQKWGTKNPVMMEDVQYGPVFLRAFGTYVIKIKDPALFLREVVGTDGQFETEEINNQLRNMIVSRFSSLLGKVKLPIMQLLANYDELSELMTKKMQPEFDAYGIQVLNLLVENISLPEDQQEMLKTKAKMQTLGSVQMSNTQGLTAFQAAMSLPDAAKNPGGLAAAGVGLGMGVGMAGQMHQAMAPAPMAPPPLPVVSFFVSLNGQQAGPFDLPTLQRYVQAGQVARNTLVWKAGLPAWMPAEQVPEMAGLFMQVPPPLPPAPPPLPPTA